MRTKLELMEMVCKISEEIAKNKTFQNELMNISCNPDTEKTRNIELEKRRDKLLVLNAKREILFWVFGVEEAEQC